jgi:hypothetical protein
VIFGNEEMNTVFPDPDKSGPLPLYTLASQVVAFNPPQGDGWNDWLDVIEAGIEAAEQVPRLAAPAVMYAFGQK